VVEDDLSIREAMFDFLDLKGYSVLQAENGQEALDVLKSTTRFPCVVVLDLAMPIMDGREFLKLRARDPILRGIPVIVVSGNFQSGAPLMGIDGYLSKPVKAEDLLDIIDRHARS
jgi:CheY-like chemotaxis protein